VIGGFVISVLTGTIALKYWWSRYPVIQRSDRLDNEIGELKAYQSSALVTLDDGRKITLPSSRNYEYAPHDLNELLKEGDYLIKHPDSDTLVIIRNKTQYTYVIGLFLNEEKRKW